MKFQFTYRHVDISPSLTAYTEEQLSRVSKHLLKESRFQVFFSMGRYDYNVDVSVNGPWGHFKASAKADDIYIAVDQASARLERQFQKQKEIHQHHKKPA